MLRDIAFTAFDVVTRVASNFRPGYCGISKVAFKPGRRSAENACGTWT
jgi:hypothetical protein